MCVCISMGDTRLLVFSLGFVSLQTIIILYLISSLPVGHQQQHKQQQQQMATSQLASKADILNLKSSLLVTMTMMMMNVSSPPNITLVVNNPKEYITREVKVEETPHIVEKCKDPVSSHTTLKDQTGGDVGMFSHITVVLMFVSVF